MSAVSVPITGAPWGRLLGKNKPKPPPESTFDPVTELGVGLRRMWVQWSSGELPEGSRIRWSEGAPMPCGRNHGDGVTCVLSDGHR